MANRVNALRLAGITRNIGRTARSIVNAQYAPQLHAMEDARQQQILQGKSQEDRARNFGTQLQQQYATTLHNEGLVSVPQNPLAAGGQATQPSTIDNWKGYLAAMSAIGGQKGAEQAGQIATATDKSLHDLSLKRTDLLAQRGGAIAKEQTDLGQQAFTNYATLEGLGIKKDSLAQQLALGNANLGYKYDALSQAKSIASTNAGLAQQRINATLTGQDLAHHDRLASIAARNGGYKGLTPAQQLAIRKSNTKIRAGIQTGYRDLVPFLTSYKDKNGATPYLNKDGSKNWKAIRYALNKRLGNDGDVVNAVINLYTNHGKLTPDIAAALRRRGIGIPKSWLNSGIGHPSTTSNGGGAQNYHGPT